MTHNESRSSETNEETKSNQSICALYGSSKCGRNGSEAKDSSEKNPRSEFVTQGSKSKTQKNGSSYTTDTGRPNLELSQCKSLTDFWKKGGGCEPDEESNEEIPPRAVEGTHMGPGKRAKLDFISFVIIVRVYLKSVGLVLFQFGSLKKSY